jgi:uncharacterized membrane protein
MLQLSAFWLHLCALQAGIFLAPCGVGVDIAILSAQRKRTQRVSQPAAIATCNTGNRHTQQVTEAAVMQNSN